jgi:hypothetical protein
MSRIGSGRNSSTLTRGLPRTTVSRRCRLRCGQEGTCHDHPVLFVRQIRPGERLSDGEPVLAAADHAEREALLRQVFRELREEAVVTVAGDQSSRWVEVASKSAFRGQIGREGIFLNRVIDATVAIDPDGVIVVPDNRFIVQELPLLQNPFWGVEDIPQAKHTAGLSLVPHTLENRRQFLQRAAGHVIDNEQVGGKVLQRGPNHLRTQGCQGGGLHGERTRRVLSVAFLAVGGQRQAIPTPGHHERACFANARYEQGTCIQRRVRQRLGNQQVPPDMAQAHGVVRVERDFRRVPRSSRCRHAKIALPCVANTAGRFVRFS